MIKAKALLGRGPQRTGAGLGAAWSGAGRERGGRGGWGGGWRPAGGSLVGGINSTLFAVETPSAMMAPISDGTVKVGWVVNSTPTTPARAPGSAATIPRGSSQDWKL